jgi:hypothetical protein
MKYSLHQQRSSIIWVAAVSPTNFTPEWFGFYNLLSEEDINAVDMKIGHESISCDFGWLEVNSFPQRVQFRLAKPGLEQAFADFVSSVITLLDTVKSYGLGLNSEFTYNVNDKDDYHKLGDVLIPKPLWYENVTSSLIDVEKQHIGMKSCRVVLEDESAFESEERRENGKNYFDQIFIDVNSKRSKKEGLAQGVEFSFNHHLAAIDGNETKFTMDIPKIILEHFIKNVKKNNETADNILTGVIG